MIQPGLQRIRLLTKRIKFPWKAIHVAGTNGKGSICAYANAMLCRKQLKFNIGTFTSPHTVDRWDCIRINELPVPKHIFDQAEEEILTLNQTEGIGASEFELLTATAFRVFELQNVGVGIIEVGMGGKEDATNIIQNQIVSVISKIGYDHQKFLGDTLEEIAAHKAGILRKGIPYIVSPANSPSVLSVIDKYAEEIGAGPRLDVTASSLEFKTSTWIKNTEHLAAFQKENARLAFKAVLDALDSLGEPNTGRCLVNMVEALDSDTMRGFLRGRLQWIECPRIFGEHRILLDGAHNADAAAALAVYINEGRQGEWNSDLGHPQEGLVWVIGMSAGRDPREVLKPLLRAGDSIITCEFGAVEGMPWVRAQPSYDLLQVAREIVPGIPGFYRGGDLLRALYTAKLQSENSEKRRPVVITGSLYLIGAMLRTMGSLDFEALDRRYMTEEVRAVQENRGSS